MATSAAASAASASASASVPTNIIIYAIPGSQFVFKVLAALQSRNIPHYVHFVPTNITQRKKVIPSGSHLVPEMQVGLKLNDRIIVSDSEKILHWLDDNMDAKLYPTPECNELSERASNKTLAAAVWYYNWVNHKGYENSMQKTFADAILPSWMPFRNTITDYAVSSYRSKYRTMVANALQMSENELLDDNHNEPIMRTKLIEELNFFQNLLSSKPNQEYLLPNTLQQPSAVDFSVYAQVERLIGTAGAASDVTIYPSIPELLTDKKDELNQLWQWHTLMQQKYPVQFRNKRIPSNILQDLGLK